MRLIDADALLKRMRKDPLFDLVERYGVSGVIDAEPTVDAEPVRHGKWIRTGRKNIYGGCELECSECGDKVMIQHIEDELYCRHCGARMDAERREE